MEGCGPSSKPHPVPRYLLIWLPCVSSVLTGGTEGCGPSFKPHLFPRYLLIWLPCVSSLLLMLWADGADNYAKCQWGNIVSSTLMRSVVGRLMMEYILGTCVCVCVRKSVFMKKSVCSVMCLRPESLCVCAHELTCVCVCVCVCVIFSIEREKWGGMWYWPICMFSDRHTDRRWTQHARSCASPRSQVSPCAHCLLSWWWLSQWVDWLHNTELLVTYAVSHWVCYVISGLVGKPVSTQSVEIQTYKRFKITLFITVIIMQGLQPNQLIVTGLPVTGF